MIDHTDHKNEDVLITYTCGGNQTQIHCIIFKMTPELKR